MPRVPLAPPGAPRVFACNSCGWCCTHLQESPGAPRAPAGHEALARHGVYRLATERGLQVWGFEKRRMEAAAAARGTPVSFAPSTVVAEEGAAGVVVLTWELTHETCPLLDRREDGSIWCGAYAARPAVCRAFPILLSGGAAVPSSKCDAAFSPAADRRDAFLAAYGASFEAAEAADALPPRAMEALRFLETAGALRLARGLSAAEVARRVGAGPVVDLLDALEGSPLPAEIFLARIPPPLR